PIFTQASSHDSLLSGMQIAWVEIEIVVLYLMVTGYDRWIPTRKSRYEIPSRDVRIGCRHNHSQAVERIVRRIWFDQSRDTGAAIKRSLPQFQISRFPFANSGMVTLFPCFQCSHDAVNALFANFHAAPNAEILQESMANEFLLACDNPRGWAAKKLVSRIDCNICALFQKELQVIFGCSIHDHRHAPGVRDLDKLA